MKDSIEERANDLAKVVTFAIAQTVRKYYNADTAQLKADYTALTSGKATRLDVVNWQKRFGTHETYGALRWNLTRRILGKVEIGGKRHNVTVGQAARHFPAWLHYQRHFTKNYASGKSYTVSGYYYIDFAVLDKLLADNAVLDAKSGYYTRRQHKLIDELILGFTDNGTEREKPTGKKTETRKMNYQRLAENVPEEDFGTETTPAAAILDTPEILDYVQRKLITPSEAEMMIRCASGTAPQIRNPKGGICPQEDFAPIEIKRRRLAIYDRFFAGVT